MPDLKILALRTYSTDHKVVAADREIFRKTDCRCNIFDAYHGSAFFAVKMDMVMRMMVCLTYVIALGKIYNPVHIRYLMNISFFFKAFKNPVNGDTITHIPNPFLNVCVR